MLNLLISRQKLKNKKRFDFPFKSQGKMSGIPRACRELKAMNPSFASGMQWIDPDGQGIGDDPIYVYCDMSTGWKLILFH